jgi:hypothetical protein
MMKMILSILLFISIILGSYVTIVAVLSTRDNEMLKEEIQTLIETHDEDIRTLTESHNKQINQMKDLPLFNMNPTHAEVVSLVRRNKIDEVPYNEDTFNCVEYSFGLFNAFLEEKIHSCVTWIIFDVDAEASHAIVAVNTSDKGVIYIEPQTDKIIYEMNLGDNYCDLVNWDCDWELTKIQSCYSEVVY